MWFNVASLNGNQEAYEQRSAIAAIMRPAVIEEAQSMAVKCIQTSYKDCGLIIEPKPKEVASEEKVVPVKFAPTSSELR